MRLLYTCAPPHKTNYFYHHIFTEKTHKYLTKLISYFNITTHHQTPKTRQLYTNRRFFTLNQTSHHPNPNFDRKYTIKQRFVHKFYAAYTRPTPKIKQKFNKTT